MHMLKRCDIMDKLEELLSESEKEFSDLWRRGVYLSDPPRNQLARHA